MKLAGPFLDRTGSLIVVEADSLAEVWALVARDPYVTEGVFNTRRGEALPAGVSLTPRASGAPATHDARSPPRSLARPIHLASRIVAAVPGVEVIAIPTDGPLPADARGEVLLTLATGRPNLADALARGVRWVHILGTGVDGFPLDLRSATGRSPARAARARCRSPSGCWRSCSPSRSAARHLDHARRRRLERRVRLGSAARPDARAGRPRRHRRGGRRARAAVRHARARRAAQRRAEPHRRRRDRRATRRARRDRRSPGARRAGDAGDAAPDRPRRCSRASSRASIWSTSRAARWSIRTRCARRSTTAASRCASLDAVDPEPLPAGHWLYTHPRVRLSPHVSWNMPGAVDVLLELFIDNLRRYRAGEPLAGVVDRAAGY